ncbi:MAG TPA: hypothetical protein PKC67_00650 [Kiritimatiellia bacterium]|nr:hypothetical protein [Kiritimatiellia bacterium]HMP32829.1 hypothetical protein [Kiritimatiellia bacterium]
MTTALRLIMLVALLASAFTLTGCATTDPDRDSDMPWNMPQSWEGSPAIPGLSN